MHFNQGAKIISDNGKEIGEISRVVIDPRNDEITHIVLHVGGLLGEDKVLPVDLVQGTEDDKVSVILSPENIADLPDFIEYQFLPLNAPAGSEPGWTESASPVIWYPPVGTSPLLWGAGYPGMAPPAATIPYKIDEKMNIPKGNIPLKEGARVTSRDGKHVGNVENILADSRNEQVTHIVITSGLIRHERKLIPANWVNQIKEDGLQLSVGSEVIAHLPDYKGP